MNMAMGYAIRCGAPGCGKPAAVKIAARWTNAESQEYKTYSICCETCRDRELESARIRRASCRMAPGEEIGELEVLAIAK